MTTHRFLWILALPLLLGWGTLPGDSPFQFELKSAQRTLDSGNLVKAAEQIERLLERDKRSIPVWDLRARLAGELGDRGDKVYALHRAMRLAVKQKLKKSVLAERRAVLLELDPIAKDLFALLEKYTGRLKPIAARYESQGRPHSAIRVWKQVLALDPENAEAPLAIERIASAPDPSLAGDAKPKDLFEDVTAEWIREHDAEHNTWRTKAKYVSDNYVTYTDAGYEVLIRSAAAMDQMNAFYRQFFRYGTEEHGGSVPRIDLNIFKNRDEYLEKGIGPPIEWSGGHFTGNAVETYIPAGGGFEGMVGTLFHEAAHQFVSLATSASGWLNEGLASFFEGTRILDNGTVLMNLPATHRLIPLAGRMEAGWMSAHDDGIDPEEATATPDEAPTFAIVLENRYQWGPPWYAPTWGVVYFLYNYQDPVDGRFVYRRSFQEFINKSGGRMGSGAVKNFEEVVLQNPLPPLKIKRPEDAIDVSLPRNVVELDAVWKDYILRLRDESQGTTEVDRPYKRWGVYAAENKLFDEAREHFEKGLVATPRDVDLLLAFADVLMGHFANPDHASKLVLEALHILEQQVPLDEKAVRKAEKILVKLDPKTEVLEDVRIELGNATKALVTRYEAAGLDSMVMDLAWRMGNQLSLPELFVNYEAALRRGSKSLAIWDLAYNEQDLEGWTVQAADGAFQPNGIFLNSKFGVFEEGVFDYQFLTLDRVTSGDFSMEAKVLLNRGLVSYAGFVFGQKGPSTFHGLLYMPGRVEAKVGTMNSDYVDLMSSFGGGTPKIWSHVPVQPPPIVGGTVSEVWRTLRLDVSGPTVDFYVDGDLLSTHEFASRDVLRGSFGLITGRGASRFRDVRYLARESGDQAAAIERELRMEEMRAAGGGALNGSYMGSVPPFPVVDEWIQGSRTSWDEFGAVPQLLVFFSVVQNETVPTDKWLMALGEALDSIDLAITIICSPNDKPRMAKYMQDHPLPGDVAIDARPETGIGLTFEQYSLEQFGLPRILLLDLDGKVIWEGDPGVIPGGGLAPGFETYLDTPMRELIARRKLTEAARWIADWESRGSALLHDGEFRQVLALLKSAEEFDSSVFPVMDRALSQMRAVSSALEALSSTSETFQQAGTSPALEVLLEWGEALEIVLDKQNVRLAKQALDNTQGRAWVSAARAVERFKKRSKIEFAERGGELIADLERLSGTLVVELLEDLKAAQNDEGRFEQLCDQAAARPAQWLARDYFGW